MVASGPGLAPSTAGQAGPSACLYMGGRCACLSSCAHTTVEEMLFDGTPHVPPCPCECSFLTCEDAELRYAQVDPGGLQDAYTSAVGRLIHASDAACTCGGRTAKVSQLQLPRDISAGDPHDAEPKHFRGGTCVADSLAQPC